MPGIMSAIVTMPSSSDRPSIPGCCQCQSRTPSTGWPVSGVDRPGPEDHAALERDVELFGLVAASGVPGQPRHTDTRHADLDVIDVGLSVHPVAALGSVVASVQISVIMTPSARFGPLLARIRRPRPACPSGPVTLPSK